MGGWGGGVVGVEGLGLVGGGVDGCCAGGLEGGGWGEVVCF